MVDTVIEVVDETTVVVVEGLDILAEIQRSVEQKQDEIEATAALVAEVIETELTPGGVYVQTDAGSMLHMVRPGEKPTHVRLAEAEALIAKQDKNLPIFANRSALRKWRAQKGKLERRILAGTGATVKLKLGVGGDSWADNAPIPQALADKLYEELGKGGDGWISTGFSTDSPALNGITLSKTGWTTFDLSADQPPTGLCGLDGLSISASAAASFIIGNCVATEFRVYYEKTGTFTWQVDGGAVNTVATDGSGGLGILTISAGLTETAHTLSLAWSAGTIKILGVYATITAKSGAELIKFGNSGLTGYDWTVLTTTAKNGMAAIASNIGIDAAMLIISTNDYRGLPTTLVWSPPFKTVEGLKAIRSCLSMPPIIVAPAQTAALAYQPQDTYRDAFWAYTQDPVDPLPFYNMHDDWPVWSVSNAEGRMKDSLHPNSAGGYDFAQAVGPNLLDLLP